MILISRLLPMIYLMNMEGFWVIVCRSCSPTFLHANPKRNGGRVRTRGICHPIENLAHLLKMMGYPHLKTVGRGDRGRRRKRRQRRGRS
uniref:Putative zinc finger CCHC domain-containing protein At4g19190 isoform X1 n=1 Tax=Rhizophora mucronata TaxID=61149 RepID=A0A2P2KNF0_RHIMU